MAVTLDSILNFVIPIIVFCVLGYVLYKPFAEPIGKLWNKISDWRENRGQEESEIEIIKSITYE